MKRHSYETGEVVFREGDRSDAAFLILSGEVEVVHRLKDGQEQRIAVLGKGEYVGEMGAIDDKPRSASAVAKGQVVCMSVDQEEFMEMLLNRPQESIDLLKVLFERLREANKRLLDHIASQDRPTESTRSRDDDA
jgi:CRP-like cAMP-binding protein